MIGASSDPVFQVLFHALSFSTDPVVLFKSTLYLINNYCIHRPTL